MQNYNWNYPTTMWVGENRIKDLGSACNKLNINKPLLVTDNGLAKSKIIEKMDNTIPSVRASSGFTLPDGMGLDLVLSIILSISLSYHMLIAPAAPAPAPIAMIENIANKG